MLGRNIQACVDDMVVTFKGPETHIVNLEKLFKTIGKHHLKHNPEKCVFGVQTGKFLRFLLTERGLETNPDKCVAIMNMRSPTNVKEVQRLTRRMASISRFLSTSRERGYPYFQCFRKNDQFIWSTEYDDTFLDLKEYLAKPLVLSKPSLGIPIRLYFSIIDRAISSVIIQDEGKGQ